MNNKHLKYFQKFNKIIVFITYKPKSLKDQANIFKNKILKSVFILLKNKNIYIFKLYPWFGKYQDVDSKAAVTLRNCDFFFRKLRFPPKKKTVVTSRQVKEFLL